MKSLYRLGLSLALLSAIVNFPLQAQDNCEALVRSAPELYFNGEFQQAINVLTVCVDSDKLTRENRISLYEVLANSYLALGDSATGNAVKMTSELLKIEPGYDPTLNQLNRPEFIRLVQTLQKGETEQPGRSFWKKKGVVFTAIAGGTALLVVGGLQLIDSSSGNGGQTTRLPLPPERPTN